MPDFYLPLAAQCHPLTNLCHPNPQWIGEPGIPCYPTLQSGVAHPPFSLAVLELMAEKSGKPT